ALVLPFIGVRRGSRQGLGRAGDVSAVARGASGETEIPRGRLPLSEARLGRGVIESLGLHAPGLAWVTLGYIHGQRRDRTGRNALNRGAQPEELDNRELSRGTTPSWVRAEARFGEVTTCASLVGAGREEW
ncbi:hypothetical protein ACJX0J_027627, partial [Zea mays]